jgi:dienelactone hydrolase
MGQSAWLSTLMPAYRAQKAPVNVASGLKKGLAPILQRWQAAGCLPQRMKAMSCHTLYANSPTGRSRRPLFQTLIVVLLVLEAGCGVIQLGMCAPHQKEEGTSTLNWTECFGQSFSHAGMTHSVYCLNAGTSKPPVLLLHELTGLTQGTLAYAEELSNDFTVYVPLLFGEKGTLSLVSGLRAYWFGGVVQFFPGGEWGIPSDGSAPIVNWLRGVVRKIEERHAEQHIGIIGNCMTGPLPVALLDHPQVGAIVVAQPALPMGFWWHTDEDNRSLGLSVDDLTRARMSRAKIFGLRFETDCIAHPEKQKTLRDEFGDRFLDGEIPASEYQIEGKPTTAHSTLIGAWKENDEAGQASRNARARVRTFLLKELGGTRPEGE